MCIEDLLHLCVTCALLAAFTCHCYQTLGSNCVFHLVNNSSPLHYFVLGDTIKTVLCPNLTTCGLL